MAPHERIAIVTGGNKGIGFAIVRQLALQYPKSSAASNTTSLLVYLAARDQSRGQTALKDISNDAQLQKAKALKADGGMTDIKYAALDISKKESIKSLADQLKKDHPDGVDIVINNAGIALDNYTYDVVKQTLDSNYYGLLDMTAEFLPLIRPGGRLVNVASQMGSLGRYSKELQDRFRSANTMGQVTELMEAYKTAVKDGKEQERGWPRSAYCVSKSGVIGATRAMAAEAASGGADVLINCCCPGYVKTDMTKQGGYRSPDEGAQTPVMLALGDIGSKSGLFWSNGQEIGW